MFREVKVVRVELIHLAEDTMTLLTMTTNTMAEDTMTLLTMTTNTMRGLFAALLVTSLSACASHVDNDVTNPTGESTQALIGNCPAANPTDDLPDDDALQACLNRGGTIRLVPGTPGYIIAKGLTLPVNGTVLTSAQAPTKATLIAAPTLNHRILFVESAANVELLDLIVDGNRAHRNDSVCRGYRDPFGTNIELGADGFKVKRIESRNALCGSALVVFANNFEVANNWIHDNGSTHGAGPEPWSDGITLAYCSGGHVHDNTVENSTDVGIVQGGGRNCNIVGNLIRQTHTFAFAGIGIADFSGSSADESGSMVQNNTIAAAPNTLGFGISVGAKPWNQGHSIGVSIVNNTVAGADINLAVAGFQGGTITGNVLSNPGGGCNRNYTVTDARGTCLQPGWLAATAHIGGTCSPTSEVIVSVCNGGPPPPPPPPRGCGVLNAGHGLAAGTGLSSCDGRFTLQMQGDGNLVVYQVAPLKPLWATATFGANYRVEMQADGRLVVYAPTMGAVWASNTAGASGNSYLAMQDDGNLVIHNQTGVVWASNTCCH